MFLLTFLPSEEKSDTNFILVPPNAVFFFLWLLFKNFLNITGFEQCDYDMSWCSYLFIYFLVLEVCLVLFFLLICWLIDFIKFGKNLAIHSLNNFFYPPLMLFYFWVSNFTSTRPLEDFPQLTDALFISNFCWILCSVFHVGSIGMALTSLIFASVTSNLLLVSSHTLLCGIAALLFSDFHLCVLNSGSLLVSAMFQLTVMWSRTIFQGSKLGQLSSFLISHCLIARS